MKTKFSGDCPSYALLRVNDIVGSKSKIIPGWNIDAMDGGPWTLPKWKNVWEKCGKDQAWYAWKERSGVGSISTTLKASGRAELSFGNCWNSGAVKVFLGGTKIASAGPNTHRVVAFDFPAGAVLSLSDGGENSIIQFTKFHILYCTNGIYW